MPPKRSEAANEPIAILLDALAVLLIKLDVTPFRLSEVARISFVRAAVAADRKKASGRPHLARIAAVTGLTRTEVKRIVDSGFDYRAREKEHLPRVLRVIEAWKSSP